MRLTLLAAVLCIVAGSAGWGEASGSAAVTSNRQGSVNSISCPAAGECVAGGSYIRGDYHEAFVVSETNGAWGDAIELPGTAALNTGGHASVLAISCVAVGECAAGGYYSDRHDISRAFVASETGGVWGNAMKVPGTPTPPDKAVGSPGVDSISCAAVGECAAGGYYVNGAGDYQAFVLSETAGTWSPAITVPGPVTQHGSAFTGVSSVACAAPGECAAGGPATDNAGHRQAFVADETNGTWGNAIKVPGLATLNNGGSAGVNSVSCPAVGACAADGYATGNGMEHAFVVSETNGTWGSAIEVPGLAALNKGVADAFTISCAAAGECAAGGLYTEGNGAAQPFVADETGGNWGNAIEVPGMNSLDAGGYGEVGSISCAAAGECAAGGEYEDGNGDIHPFLVNEAGGVWGTAIQVPGAAKLGGRGNADVRSISCAGVGDCAAGGVVGGPWAFAAEETSGSWANATLIGSFPVSCVVPNVVSKKLIWAKKALHAAACSVGAVKLVSSKAAKGLVIRQQPAPGTSLDPGERVALIVSKGRKAK